jgi:hypothetical protein
MPARVANSTRNVQVVTMRGCPRVLCDEPEERAEFDAYASNYDRQIDHVLRRIVDVKGDYFVRLKCGQIRESLRELGVDASRIAVADVGCGVGDFERILH